MKANHPGYCAIHALLPGLGNRGVPFANRRANLTVISCIQQLRWSTMSPSAGKDF